MHFGYPPRSTGSDRLLKMNTTEILVTYGSLVSPAMLRQANLALKKPGRRSWCTQRIQLAAVYTGTSLQLARKVFPSPVVRLVELVPPRAQLPWKE